MMTMKTTTLVQDIVRSAKTGEYTIESVADAGAHAFKALKEVLEGAFKTDGMRGVVQTAEDLVDGVKEQVVEAEAEHGDEASQHGAVAAYIEQFFCPVKMDLFARIAAAGGLTAVLAK